MVKFLSKLLILLFFTAACNTINLTEKDAFDIKRTISPEFFENRPQNIEEVIFKSGDSLELNGWFIHNNSSNLTILYCGGNGFVRVTSYHIIKSIIDQNVNLQVFDYRGYGNNPGKPTVSGLKEDGLAAYDFLINIKQIDPVKLIIHGHSLGSFIASFVAGKREAAGLVLECPITDAKDWTGRLVPWLLKPFIKFDIDPVLLENSNVEQLSNLEIPLLILAGEKDQVTPPGMADKLYQQAKSSEKQLIIIKDGGHNDLPQQEVYHNALYNFYSKIKKKL